MYIRNYINYNFHQPLFDKAINPFSQACSSEILPDRQERMSGDINKINKNPMEQQLINREEIKNGDYILNHGASPSKGGRIAEKLMLNNPAKTLPKEIKLDDFISEMKSDKRMTPTKRKCEPTEIEYPMAKLSRVDLTCTDPQLLVKINAKTKIGEENKKRENGASVENILKLDECNLICDKDLSNKSSWAKNSLESQSVTTKKSMQPCENNIIPSPSDQISSIAGNSKLENSSKADTCSNSKVTPNMSQVVKHFDFQKMCKDLNSVREDDSLSSVSSLCEIHAIIQSYLLKFDLSNMNESNRQIFKNMSYLDQKASEIIKYRKQKMYKMIKSKEEYICQRITDLRKFKTKLSEQSTPKISFQVPESTYLNQTVSTRQGTQTFGEILDIWNNSSS